MRLFRLSLAIVALGAPLSSLAQVNPPPGWGTPEWYKEASITVINNARKMVEPVLPLASREVARHVLHRVTASPGFGAFAAWESDRRLVVIHAGTIQMCEYLAEAIIFNDELGATGCFDEYSNYLGTRLIENSNRMADHLDPRPLVNPLLFSDSIGQSGPCGKIDGDDFRTRPDLGEHRAKMMDASIVFLYLHELAHHLLGHADNLKPGHSPPSIDTRRRQEDEADRWAITTALKARHNLLAAAPVFNLIALTGGNSLEAERLTDHPLGIRRVLTLFEEVANFYEQHPDSWRGPPTLKTFLKDLRKQHEGVKALIRSL